MATVRISLPEYLEEFLDAEVAANPALTRAEFVEQLVLKAYLQKNQEQLEPLLLQGLQGPMTPMTRKDWEEIRREGLAHLAKEKKDAVKRRKKSPRSKRPA